MLVHRVRNLQPIDECECKDILTTTKNFVLLALKVADKGFKAVTLPRFDSEK